MKLPNTFSMKMIPPDQLLEVSEFALIVSFVTCGFKVEHVDRSDPRRVIFGFRRSRQLDEIASSYWRGTLMVPATTFYQTLGLLKARLRNEVPP